MCFNWVQLLIKWHGECKCKSLLGVSSDFEPTVLVHISVPSVSGPYACWLSLITFGSRQCSSKY